MKTYGFGVHRFDTDTHYAYISTEMAGNMGNILVTCDIADPDPGPGGPPPQSNDVDLDDRGLIYLLDRVNGLDILEMTT